MGSITKAGTIAHLNSRPSETIIIFSYGNDLRKVIKFVFVKLAEFYSSWC